MAFVTYVLLIAYHLGQQGRFTPEVFGLTASRGLGVVLLEVVLMKGTFYFFPSAALSSGATGAALLDLVAYSGYKFVGIVISMVLGLFAPIALKHALTVYVALCAGARAVIARPCSAQLLPTARRRCGRVFASALLRRTRAIAHTRSAAPRPAGRPLLLLVLRPVVRPRAGFFILKTLTEVRGSATLTPEVMKQNYCIFAIAGLQIFFAWYLGYA
jgi:hypothetical protein